MPELPNIKHELFCKQVIKQNGHITKAYSEVYPDCSNQSLAPAASRMMSMLSVQERVAELLNSQGLSIEELNAKLKQLVNSKKAIILNNKLQYVDDNPTQLESTKTAYRLHGLLSINNSNTTINDNRKLDIAFNSSEDLNKLDNIIANLSNLSSKEVTDIAIHDYVVDTDNSSNIDTGTSSSID